MPVFASFVALSGRILRGNGKRPEWVSNVIGSDMTSGQSFSSTVQAEGIPAPAYSVSSGSLPPGLSLNSSTGQLSGTPNTAGSYSFSIRATNAVGYVEQSYSRIVVLPMPASVSYLVVAGGGGGRMGGGGAGGMRNGTYSVVSGQNISVTVGAGGGFYGDRGGSSVGFGITNTGGGRGGDVQAVDRSGRSGGSGGGGSAYYNGSPGTSGQGNAGGNGSNGANGGGGGKGSAGGFGGGNGATWINGTGYAGGGRGSGTNAAAYGASTSVGGAGAANTGAGGGGNAAPDAGGGTGGSGIVAFRQLTSERLPTISAGLTYTTNVSGSYRYYYLKGGTGTVNWS